MPIAGMQSAGCAAVAKTYGPFLPWPPTIVILSATVIRASRRATRLRTGRAWSSHGQLGASGVTAGLAAGRAGRPAAGEQAASNAASKNQGATTAMIRGTDRCTAIFGT